MTSRPLFADLLYSNVPHVDGNELIAAKLERAIATVDPNANTLVALASAGPREFLAVIPGYVVLITFRAVRKPKIEWLEYHEVKSVRAAVDGDPHTAVFGIVDLITHRNERRRFVLDSFHVTAEHDLQLGWPGMSSHDAGGSALAQARALASKISTAISTWSGPVKAPIASVPPPTTNPPPAEVPHSLSATASPPDFPIREFDQPSGPQDWKPNWAGLAGAVGSGEPLNEVIGLAIEWLEKRPDSISQDELDTLNDAHWSYREEVGFDHPDYIASCRSLALALREVDHVEAGSFTARCAATAGAESIEDDGWSADAQAMFDILDSLPADRLPGSAERTLAALRDARQSDPAFSERMQALLLQVAADDSARHEYLSLLETLPIDAQNHYRRLLAAELF